MEITLLNRTSIEPYGGYQFFADVNGDGEKEILCLQAAGIFYSRVHSVRGSGRQHFCLTALTSQGELLWQVGTPWSGSEPFLTHCAERSLDVADINGDGYPEVLCLQGTALLVLDGRTGVVLSKVDLPADNFAIVAAAKTGPGADEYTILVQNSEKAYPPHTYGNPCLFFSANLDLLDTRELRGAGHLPLVSDLDGDGYDEFIIGYNWLDHDLSVRFIFDPQVEEYDPPEHHVDALAVDGQPVRKLALAASEYVYIVDDQGDLLWSRELPHPQQCHFTMMRDDVPGPQVFVHNKRDRLQLFSADGSLIWEVWPEEYWPLGKPSAVRMKFHQAMPTFILPGVLPGGMDALLYSEGGWPYIVDGSGRCIAHLPHDEYCRQDFGEVPGRPDDFGYSFNSMVFADDLGPGKHRVYVFDRRYVWEYAVTRDT